MTNSPNQKPKSRLGRGLSSLISVSELPVEAEILAGSPESPMPDTVRQPSAMEIPLDKFRRTRISLGEP